MSIVVCSSAPPPVEHINIGRFQSFEDYQSFYNCGSLSDDGSENISNYPRFPYLQKEWDGNDFQDAIGVLEQISDFNYPRHCSPVTGLIFERFITWDNFKSFHAPGSGGQNNMERFTHMYKSFFALFTKYAEANEEHGLYERELYFLLPTSIELMNRLVNMVLQQSNSIPIYHPNYNGFQTTRNKTIGDLNFLINNALDLISKSKENEHDQLIVSNRLLMSFFGMIYFVNQHNRIKGNEIFQKLEKKSSNLQLAANYNKLSRLFYSR